MFVAELYISHRDAPQQIYNFNNEPASPVKPCGPMDPLPPFGPRTPCGPGRPLSPGILMGSGAGPRLPGKPGRPRAQKDQVIRNIKIQYVVHTYLSLCVIYLGVQCLPLDLMGLVLPSHQTRQEYPSIPVLLSPLQQNKTKKEDKDCTCVFCLFGSCNVKLLTLQPFFFVSSKILLTIYSVTLYLKVPT